MANSVVSETTKRLFTADTLRIAAKHSIGCFVVPVRLRRAIKKYIRDNEDRHIKKKVLRLSQSLNEIKATNLLIAASETSRNLIEDPQSRTSKSSRRWKIQSSYGDNGLVYRDDETIAYVASRMPAVFSACYRVLSELHTRLPGFTPTTVLDFGAGTGSAFWALRELWPKSLKKVNIVEPSQSMQRAGQGLIQGLKNLPTIHSYDSIKNLCKKLKMPERKHNIVIASYVIGEIPSTRDRITTVRQLWQLTDDILVLIEPGTPQGFKTISQMRSHILWMEKRKLNKLNAKKDEHCRDLTDPSQGAHIVAPCSHDGACPLERTGTYCHFVQRLQRTNTQRQFKTSNGRALRGFEDEKFSFVVIRRGQRPKETWPLDAMYFENLKEQKARLKQEGLGIYHENDFEEEEEEEEALETHQDSYDSDKTTNIDTERREEEGETDQASYDSDDTTNIDEEREAEEQEEEDSDDANDNFEEEEEEEERDQLINASDREMDEDDDDEKSGGEQNDNEDSEARANLGGGWGRIVFSPICRGRHVILNVCRSANAEATSGSYKQIIMTKSKNPTLHRHARKSMWGDLWPN